MLKYVPLWVWKLVVYFELWRTDRQIAKIVAKQKQRETLGK